MPKYVNADKIIEHLNDEIEGCEDCGVCFRPVTYGTRIGLEYSKSLVETAETADVQEVRHGRWISNETSWFKWTHHCSECGWIDGYLSNDRYTYCPNCGTKMDGGREADTNNG